MMYFRNVLLHTLVLSVSYAASLPPDAKGTPTFEIAKADAARRSCTVSSRTPSPTAATCGKAGSVQRPQVQVTGMTFSADDCRNGCLFKNDQCVSYSWDSMTGECNLYTATVKGSGFVPDPKSTTKFWHRVCWSKKCVTPEPPPPAGPSSAQAPCGQKICGQAYHAQGSYQDQYLVQCGQNYNTAAYNTIDTANFFDCIDQCDFDSSCFRASFDHTLETQNCFFFDKTQDIDGSLSPDANFDSVEVAGTYYPNAPNASYRGKDDNYDLETCPTTTPVVPSLSQCNTRIQGNHGPNSCTYTVRCNTKYKGTALTTMPTSTYFGCLDVCDKNLKCDSITWEQSTKMCTIWLESEFQYHDKPFQNNRTFLGYQSAFFNYDCPYLGDDS